MNKTRFAVKCFAGAVTMAVLAIGAVSAPAQAADTGWDKVGVSAKGGGPQHMHDTGWDIP
jgi:hypothetical protein